jgi:hypothetical protein
VQSVFPLRGSESALKLTTALYYTPSGRSIHRHTTQAELDSAAGDQESDGGALPAAPSADTSAAPRYHTVAGRSVFGGGGIRPDVIVASDSLPPIARIVETRGLAFRFASRWANTHAHADLARVDDAEWRDFIAFLAAEKAPTQPQELTRERPLLTRSLRRELARRMGGDQAAARVALESDPVYGQALEILNRARTAREVFRLAAAPSSGARR